MTKGGPNSAVELLEEMGFQCGREAGRAVVVGKGGDLWGRLLFGGLVSYGKVK